MPPPDVCQACVLKISGEVTKVKSWRQSQDIEGFQNGLVDKLEEFVALRNTFEEQLKGVKDVRADRRHEKASAKRHARHELDKVAKTFMKKDMPTSLANIFAASLLKSNTDPEDVPYVNDKDFGHTRRIEVADSDDSYEIGKQFHTALEAHKKTLDKKSEKLRAQLKSGAAMALVKLGDKSFDLTHRDIGLELVPGGDIVLTNPIAVALKLRTWVWDYRAWPFPGAPSLIYAYHGNAIFTFYDLKALKEKGMRSLMELDKFASWHKLDNSQKTSVVLQQGQGLTIPVGQIPIVSGLGKDKPKDAEEDDDEYEKSMLLVIPLFTTTSRLADPSNDAIRLDLKQYLEALYKECGTAAVFKQVAPAVELWAGFAQGTLVK